MPPLPPARRALSRPRGLSRQRRMRSLTAGAAAAAVLLTPALALAHAGHLEAASFSAGFLHPLGGLDHLLAMVAVGLFAAMLGGAAIWLVPGAFLAMMAAGAALGIAGFGLPMVELGIALSLVLLGMAIALRLNLATLAAMAIVGFFALFHGLAHGAEMPAAGTPLIFGAGFLLATALLHGAGLLLGLVLGLSAARTTLPSYRIGGGAIALAGAGLLAGLV